MAEQVPSNVLGNVWVVYDPDESDIVIAYIGDGAEHMCHEHINEALDDDDLVDSAKQWVVRGPLSSAVAVHEPPAVPLKDPRECKHETALFKCDECGLDFKGLRPAAPIGDSVRPIPPPPGACLCGESKALLERMKAEYFKDRTLSGRIQREADDLLRRISAPAPPPSAGMDESDLHKAAFDLVDILEGVLYRANEHGGYGVRACNMPPLKQAIQRVKGELVRSTPTKSSGQS